MTPMPLYVAKRSSRREINGLDARQPVPATGRYAMLQGLIHGRSILAALRAFLGSRGDTALKVLVLRQQVAVLTRQRPRPQLRTIDRLFWTTLRRLWSNWASVLVLVKRRRSWLGIVRASAGTGAGALAAAADHRGNRGPDSAAGAREPGLGGPEDPRRTAKARLRRFRTERGPLSATNGSSP